MPIKSQITLKAQKLQSSLNQSSSFSEIITKDSNKFLCNVHNFSFLFLNQGLFLKQNLFALNNYTILTQIIKTMNESRFRSLDDLVTKIQNGGLFNKQKCLELTRKVFEMYDDNKDGVLETITAGKMLMDLYRSMNKEFHPTATDIASFARIFDRDNKGKITFEDMTKFAFKYYCTEEY